MPRKAKGLGPRAQIDREIRDLDKDRARLVAARAILDGQAVMTKPRPPRVSQDDVADYLREHPGSTYLEVANGMGISPTTAAGHLKRGRKTGRFRNEAGKWYLVEGWRE
jgi:hypothetical protein